MRFARFIRACRKYRFTFVLTTYGGFKVVLRPNETFENIEVVDNNADYRKLFKSAIKAMKEYREKHPY